MTSSMKRWQIYCPLSVIPSTISTDSEELRTQDTLNLQINLQRLCRSDRDDPGVSKEAPAEYECLILVFRI